jgi:hypothetical protein
LFRDLLTRVLTVQRVVVVRVIVRLRSQEFNSHGKVTAQQRLNCKILKTMPNFYTREPVVRWFTPWTRNIETGIYLRH